MEAGDGEGPYPHTEPAASRAIQGLLKAAAKRGLAVE